VIETSAEEVETPREQRRFGRRLLIGIVIAIVLAGLAVTWFRGSERPTVSGMQAGAPRVEVGSAAGLAWESLTPVSGSGRAEFPVPMVSRTDGVCFGFARLDFDPPARPSVARCVAGTELVELRDNGIRSLIIIRAGHDNWHLVQTGRGASEVTITLADGTRLDDSRLHLLDDLIALRLPVDRPVHRVEWIVGRRRVVCEAVTDATASGRFCPAAP
jgi:hypothetical protein